MLSHRAVVWVGLIAICLTVGAPALSARVASGPTGQATRHGAPALCADSGSPTPWVFDRAEVSGSPGTQPVTGAVNWDALPERSVDAFISCAAAGRLTFNDRHTSLHWLCRLTV